MKRIVASILAFLFCLFLGWYSGLDFLERGLWQAYALLFCAFVAALVFTYPGWGEQ